MNSPAIVVVAYNRAGALQRLLKSLADGSYPNEQITLHISIDQGGSKQVIDLANNFEWKFGAKYVEVQDEHLGLKHHIFKCGKLTQDYRAIILLEDDVFVAPNFYNYTTKALEFYDSDNRIGGISLYNYEVAESCHLPFTPVSDGSDVYFMQVASSWGQAWTAKQLRAFKEWIQVEKDNRLGELPNYIQQWGTNSWKKYYINYLMCTQRYFVFPRRSYSTNFEDVGTNATTSDLFQVNLSGEENLVTFNHLNESNARYDAWFELEAACVKHWSKELTSYEFDVDLYGAKELSELRSSYVLTTRIGEEPVLSFAGQMKPLINNIKYGLIGEGIGLYVKAKLNEQRPSSSLYFSKDLLRRAEEITHSISLSVVLPMLEVNEKKLMHSVESVLANGIETECICVGTEELMIAAKSIIGQRSRVRFVHVDSTDLMQSVLGGFAKSRMQVVTWMNPGSLLQLNATERLYKLFEIFKSISSVVGLNSPPENGQVSVSHNRLNASILKTYGGRSSTELVFWRRKDINSDAFVWSGQTEEEWFEQMLVAQKLYATDVCFGMSEQLKNDNFKDKNSSSVGWIRRWKYKKFLNENSPWRILFLEQEHLPDVLRYDSQNDNFYLSRY